MNVFIDNIQMETQTVFTSDGNINIYPCSFELGQHIVAGGNEVSQKGRMTVEDDGTSHFRPYAKDTGSRYRTLFVTPHGEMKETGGSVIFTLRFPKRLGKDIIAALHRTESEQQAGYITSQYSETQW